MDEKFAVSLVDWSIKAAIKMRDGDLWRRNKFPSTGFFRGLIICNGP